MVCAICIVCIICIVCYGCILNCNIRIVLNCWSCILLRSCCILYWSSCILNWSSCILDRCSSVLLRWGSIILDRSIILRGSNSWLILINSLSYICDIIVWYIWCVISSIVYYIITDLWLIIKIRSISEILLIIINICWIKRCLISII